MPSIRLTYPLNEQQLNVFRARFSKEFNTSLFYTTDSFINAAFQEFAEANEDEHIVIEHVMYVCAAAEDNHCLDRKMQMYTRQVADQSKICPRCQGTSFFNGMFCGRCGGAGRVPRNLRSR